MRHDVLIGERWNVDHVVVGPPGVFLLDTKVRNGAVTIARDGVRLDGRRTDMTEKIQSQARTVSAQLRELSGTRVWVQPVLVFDNDLRGETQPEGVHVVGLGNVAEYIQRMPTQLSEAEVQRFGRALLNDSCWPHDQLSNEPEAVFYRSPRRPRALSILAIGCLAAIPLVAAVYHRGAENPQDSTASAEPKTVEQIRARYQAVGATQYKLTKVEKSIFDESGQRSSLNAYFDGATLKKAEWLLARERLEMMFHEDRLEFVFKEAGETETRHYLVNGTVVWATKGRTRVPMNTRDAAEFLELERRVKAAIVTDGDRLRFEAGVFVRIAK